MPCSLAAPNAPLPKQLSLPELSARPAQPPHLGRRGDVHHRHPAEAGQRRAVQGQGAGLGCLLECFVCGHCSNSAVKPTIGLKGRLVIICFKSSQTHLTTLTTTPGQPPGRCVPAVRAAARVRRAPRALDAARHRQHRRQGAEGRPRAGPRLRTLMASRLRARANPLLLAAAAAARCRRRRRQGPHSLPWLDLTYAAACTLLAVAARQQLQLLRGSSGGGVAAASSAA